MAAHPRQLNQRVHRGRESADRIAHPAGRMPVAGLARAPVEQQCRISVELAKRGWDVTGVDFVEKPWTGDASGSGPPAWR